MTKLLKFTAITLGLSVLAACGSSSGSNTSPVPPSKAVSPADSKPAATPMPTMQPTPKNGEYPGKGKVTKIKMEDGGSVELNHQEIVGVMPAMLMEFYVTDKAILKGVAVGDEVSFTLKYEDGRETISKIEKIK